MSTHELFGSDSESSDNDGETQELPSTQAHMEDLFGNASDSNEEIEMDSDMKKKGYQSYPIQDQGSDSSSNEDDEENKIITAINKPTTDEPMNVDQELDFSGTEETDTKRTNDEGKLSDEEGTKHNRINNDKKLNEKEILNQSMPTTQDLFGEDLDDDDDSDDSSIKGVKLQTAPTTQDLFGDEDLDMSSDEETLNEPSNERNKESTDRMIQDSDEEQPPSPEEEKEEEGLSISIELPRCNMSLGKELYFVKLPNFLSVDTKPFDPTLYEDEIDDDEILDEEGRTRLKLKVENTLRWRYSKDREGNEVKESNCRFVRWSDGSLTMHLGNEVFDVFKMPIEGEQNHLFVQQGTGLQAQAVFKTKLTFRPQSTASQTHRKMTMSIADRMSKAQKIKFMPATDHDPESQRSTIMKKEDERMRAQSRRESQQRRMREKNHLKGMTTSYLEGDLDADEEDFDNSIAAIKNRYKKDVKGGGRNPYHEVYSDESDGDNKLEKAKLDFDSDDDDLSDPDIRRKKEELSKKKKGGRKVIEESDEEESD